MSNSEPAQPDLQRVLGVVMFSVSLVLGVLALGGRRGALVASLVPLVDVRFGLAFLAAQLLFCAIMRFKEGFGWIAGSVLLAAPLLALGNVMSQRSGATAVTGLDRVIGGAALLSGCVLGWKAWKAQDLAQS